MGRGLLVIKATDFAALVPEHMGTSLGLGKFHRLSMLYMWDALTAEQVHEVLGLRADVTVLGMKLYGVESAYHIILEAEDIEDAGPDALFLPELDPNYGTFILPPPTE